MITISELVEYGFSEYHIVVGNPNRGVNEKAKFKVCFMKSNEILDREFLEIRAKVLEVAASLDRIERADGDVSGDARTKLLQDAIDIIASRQPDSARAEKIQLLFSREYDENWLEDFAMVSRT